MEFFQNAHWAKIGGGVQIFDRFAGHKKKFPYAVEISALDF